MRDSRDRSVVLSSRGRRISLDHSPANNTRGHLLRAHVSFRGCHQPAGLTETLRSRTPRSLKNLVLGRWPLQIGSSQCAASYPCQVRIVFLYLLSFWTHYQQLHGMRNAARGMVFGLKSTGANWLTAAPLVERFGHFTAFTTPSPRVRSYREAAVAT